MEITDVPFAVLRFQYQLARLPLQLIEEQVVAGMSSEAPTRLFYERWLGGLDAAVGKMLGDPDLEKRGAALIERSDALRRAAQLDATATQNQERADDELKAMTGAFDRFAKATAQKSWKIGDTIRTLPIVDGFATPTKINQIVLNELPIDYSFKQVPRYDRCMTCHLGIDRGMFEKSVGAVESLVEACKKIAPDLGK